jgi:hypothetical protein
MGEYASLVLSQQLGISWDDADDLLYGGGPTEPLVTIPTERRCPICAVSRKTRDGVIQHINDVHRRTGEFKKSVHQHKFAEWWILTAGAPTPPTQDKKEG